jgi:hypothetical protein
MIDGALGGHLHDGSQSAAQDGDALDDTEGADGAPNTRKCGKASVHGAHQASQPEGEVAVSRLVEVADSRDETLGFDDERGVGSGLIGESEGGIGAATANDSTSLVADRQRGQRRRVGVAVEVSIEATVLRGKALGFGFGFGVEGGDAFVEGDGHPVASFSHAASASLTATERGSPRRVASVSSAASRWRGMRVPMVGASPAPACRSIVGRPVRPFGCWEFGTPPIIARLLHESPMPRAQMRGHWR